MRESLPRYCLRCGSLLETRMVHGLERKACGVAGCGFVFWDNPLPVAGALVLYQEKVVLARNAKWPRRIFSLITGFIERNESPEQAVVREVKEELGLDGVVDNFIGTYPFFPMNQLILAYGVRAEGELKLGDEIAEVKLVSKTELSDWSFGRLVVTTAIVNDWIARQSSE